MIQLGHRLALGMKAGGWAVPFSIGVVDLEELPDDPEQALAIGDALMYRVKPSTKNNILCET